MSARVGAAGARVKGCGHVRGIGWDGRWLTVFEEDIDAGDVSFHGRRPERVPAITRLQGDIRAALAQDSDHGRVAPECRRDERGACQSGRGE